jgi:hypothetical protein
MPSRWAPVKKRALPWLSSSNCPNSPNRHPLCAHQLIVSPLCARQLPLDFRCGVHVECCVALRGAPFNIFPAMLTHFLVGLSAAVPHTVGNPASRLDIRDHLTVLLPVAANLPGRPKCNPLWVAWVPYARARTGRSPRIARTAT